MFELKKGEPAFEIVDGPMTGRSFQPGQKYKEIPDNYKDRFAKVKSPVPSKSKTPVSTAKKETDK